MTEEEREKRGKEDRVRRQEGRRRRGQKNEQSKKDTGGQREVESREMTPASQGETHCNGELHVSIDSSGPKTVKVLCTCTDLSVYVRTSHIVGYKLVSEHPVPTKCETFPTSYQTPVNTGY